MLKIRSCGAWDRADPLHQPADIDPDRVKFLRPSAPSAARPLTRPFPPDQARRSLAAVMADVTSPRNLNPARPHRSYPRVVRRARHHSDRVKRPGDTITRYHGPPTIRLVNSDHRPS